MRWNFFTIEKNTVLAHATTWMNLEEKILG